MNNDDGLIDGLLTGEVLRSAPGRRRDDRHHEPRLAVLDAERVALAVDIALVRRVQFDIEKSRPATLVIVPERPTDAPRSWPSGRGHEFCCGRPGGDRRRLASSRIVRR